MLGALAGTSTVVNYIESAAGVVAGGRSGATSVVTGLLFLVALFIAPVFGVIPMAATAPALIIVGSLMISNISEIEWGNPVIAVPAFLTMTTIPLTYSIANGIAFVHRPVPVLGIGLKKGIDICPTHRYTMP